MTVSCLCYLLRQAVREQDRPRMMKRIVYSVKIYAHGVDSCLLRKVSFYLSANCMLAIILGVSKSHRAIGMVYTVVNRLYKETVCC